MQLIQDQGLLTQFINSSVEVDITQMVGFGLLYAVGTEHAHIRNQFVERSGEGLKSDPD